MFNREKALFEKGTTFEMHHYYEDKETFRLVQSMSTVLGIKKMTHTHTIVPIWLISFEGITMDQAWEAFGQYFAVYVCETGWKPLLSAMAYNLQVTQTNFVQN